MWLWGIMKLIIDELKNFTTLSMGKEENIRHKGALGEWGLGVEGYVVLGIIALILVGRTPELLKIMYFGKR